MNLGTPASAGKSREEVADVATGAVKRPGRPSIESGEAMCAINAQYRIIGWNRAAEQLFGVPRHEAMGRPCYEVVAGKDAKGSPVCGRGCLPMQLATRGLPVGAMDMERKGAAGEPRTLGCTTLLSHGNGGPASTFLFHIFRPNDDRLKLKGLLSELAQVLNRRGLEPAPPAAQGPSDGHLTGRELEILGLLRQGLGTKEMADRLFVSPLTVRNHIQNVRGKLRVHTRLQAVTAAERRGLL